MKENRDFINNYNSIRRILWYLFIYGCLSADDFEKMGISKRKYIQDKNRFRAFIDPRFIEEQTICGKKATFFKINMFQQEYNYLAGSFQMKSFTDKQGALYLRVLQILSATKDSLTRNQVLEKLCDTGMDDVDSTTLYRLLKGLKNYGTVRVIKFKGGDRYQLEKDVLEDLCPKEIQSLYQAVDFFSNILYPSSVGFFLLEAIRDYGVNDQESLFLFKHNHLVHILDDEILLQIMEGMYRKHLIIIHYLGEGGEKKKKKAIPLKIIADEKYGRRFLYCMSDQAWVIRLDKIQEIEITKEPYHDTEKEVEDWCRRDLSNSLTGGTLPKSSGALVVELMCDSSALARIETEMRGCGVEQVDEDMYRIRLWANDPIELKPWLREYQGHICVLPNDVHKLAEEMTEELVQWRKRYGLIS